MTNICSGALRGVRGENEDDGTGVHGGNVNRTESIHVFLSSTVMNDVKIDIDGAVRPQEYQM